MASPIKPNNFNPLATGQAACDVLKVLLQMRPDIREHLAWFLEDDSTGNLNAAGFLTDLSEQFLFDAAKKGFWVRAHPTTGFLELTEFIPLESLDGSGSTEGDTLAFEGGVWITKPTPSIYLAPTSGGATIPAVTSGGRLTVAHGLGAAPRKYSAHLECNSADVNYAVGDRVDALSLMFLNSATPEVMPGATVFANANLVGVVFRDGGAGDSYQLHDNSTFMREPITPANWDVKLFAEA